MRKDPGPTPIPARNRIKEKPVYDKVNTDRGKERKRNWSIEQLRRVLGYGIDDEINWDEVGEVVSFVPFDPSGHEKVNIFSLGTGITSTPEEIAKEQELIMKSGLRMTQPLPDPYSPLPIVNPE